MNEQKKREFTLACKQELSNHSLTSLRTYGRNVGVSSPTSRGKTDLIEKIVGILTEEIPATVRNGRGAPVLNDVLDQKLVAAIERLKAEYQDQPPKQPELHYNVAEMRKAMKHEPLEIILHQDNSVRDENGELSVFRGQLTTLNDVAVLLPLNCVENGNNVLIATDFIRHYVLKEGDVLTCNVDKTNDAFVATHILTINGADADYFKRGEAFETAEVCYPVEKVKVFDAKKFPSTTAKYADWVLPFGKGHRAVLCGSPKSGKTQFLRTVARAAAALNKHVTVLFLLVGQSPEAITEFRQSIDNDCLAYTTYEDEPERQVFVADFMLNRAKRLAECGQDVLLFVDSFNNLSRAFNDTEASAGGKTFPCGLEVKTVQYIKKYFGSARCFAKGGSLTILGSVSCNTGNPADDIFTTELTAIANLELRLDDTLAEKRIFPAVKLQSAFVKAGTPDGKTVPELFTMLAETESMWEDDNLLRLLERSSSYQDFIKNLRALHG